MKCIAIDDEPMALEILTIYSQRIEDMNLLTFTNPLLGLEAVQNERPDVVFLDIEMNEHSGLEIAKKLPEGTLLIFTTAYDNYALMGFELNALDYLHKPINFDRFMMSIERIRKTLSLKHEFSQQHETISITCNYKKVQIPLFDIIYIEAVDNYLHIYRIDGQILKTKLSMSGILSRLPASSFLRIHRSFIIGRKHILSYTKQQVTLASASDPCTLPVGRSYADEFASWGDPSNGQTKFC